MGFGDWSPIFPQAFNMHFDSLMHILCGLSTSFARSYTAWQIR